MPLLTSRPPRLRIPPPRERRRRLRSRIEVRRRPFGRLALAVARIDQSVLVAMRTRGHGRAAEALARALSDFGELGAGWAVIGLGGAGLDRERRRSLLAATLAAPAALCVNFLVKASVGRERPVIEGHPPLAPAPNKLSFPSAHAATSVAGAVALGRAAPPARLPLYALAALTCAGRPYLGMHYPSDVLAGVALGLAIGRLWPLPTSSRPLPAPPAPEPSTDGEPS